VVQFSPTNECQEEGTVAKRMPDQVQKQVEQMTEAFHESLTELYWWSNDTEPDCPPTAITAPPRDQYIDKKLCYLYNKDALLQGHLRTTGRALRRKVTWQLGIRQN